MPWSHMRFFIAFIFSWFASLVVQPGNTQMEQVQRMPKFSRLKARISYKSSGKGRKHSVMGSPSLISRTACTFSLLIIGLYDTYTFATHECCMLAYRGNNPFCMGF